MHDNGVRLGQGELSQRRAPRSEIFAHTRHIGRVHALALEAQHHDDICAGEGVLHARENVHAEAVDAGRQQGRRRSHPDARTHGG
jgi:hypothetical protein